MHTYLQSVQPCSTYRWVCTCTAQWHLVSNSEWYLHICKYLLSAGSHISIHAPQIADLRHKDVPFSCIFCFYKLSYWQIFDKRQHMNEKGKTKKRWLKLKLTIQKHRRGGPRAKWQFSLTLVPSYMSNKWTKILEVWKWQSMPPPGPMKTHIQIKIQISVWSHIKTYSLTGARLLQVAEFSEISHRNSQKCGKKPSLPNPPLCLDLHQEFMGSSLLHSPTLPPRFDEIHPVDFA